MGRPKLELTGRRFGRLVVMGPCGTKNGRTLWQCRCDCGVERTAKSDSLTGGDCKSCGCLGRGVRGDPRRKKENLAWLNIIRRCYVASASGYNHYGGRGIRMCNRWRDSFDAFFLDMGPSPSPEHTIDRVDNDAHYSCGHCSQCRENGWSANCRWATRKEQSQNKRTNHVLTMNGESHCISEWAERLGIPACVIQTRASHGLPASEILATGRLDPSRNRKVIKIEFAGESLRVSQWAKRLGISVHVIHRRLRSGCPVEAVLSATRLPNPTHKRKVRPKDERRE